LARPSDISGLRPKASLQEAARRIVRSRLSDVRRHSRIDETNPGAYAVKDLRVALRRLRTAVEFFTWAPAPFRQSIRTVGAALGAVRDSEVQLAWLDSVVERRLVGDRALAGMRRLRSEIETASSRQRHDAFDKIRGWLDLEAKLVANLPFPLRGQGRLNGHWTRDRLEKRAKDLRQLGMHLRENFDIGHAHEFRTRLRQIRYQAELLEPVFPKRAGGIVKRSVPALDVIGQWCDVDQRKALVEKFAVRARAEDEAAVIELLQLLDVEQSRAEQRARSALFDWLARRKRPKIVLVAA